MKITYKKLIGFSLIIGLALFAAGCNMPSAENENASQTSAAQTDEASNQVEATATDQSPIPTQTEPAGSVDDGEETQTSDLTPTSTQAITATPTSEGEVGEDRAEFIGDITFPDYSEVQFGEEITKTWRVQNTGNTTWTTDYIIEFEKGEKLGAATQIKLPEDVKPGDLIDISIKFTVPSTAGEYSSYWILKNEDGQRIGVAEEGKYFSMFMIIVAVDDDGDGGTSGTGGISGGAKVTNATVSVDDANYSGSCPAPLTFTYTVTTSNAGKVNFQLKFKVISPSGYTFDPPPQYSVNFTGGYTVTYTYSFSSSNSVNGRVVVEAIGSNTYTSAPLNFKVNCN